MAARKTSVKTGKGNRTLILDDGGLEKAIRKAMKESPALATKAVMDCALDLAAKSAHLAPIESGDLKNNCHAEVNGVKVFENQSSTAQTAAPSKTPVGIVGYSLPYALRQHEELSYRHDRTDGHKRPDGSTYNMVAGGQAKYLEAPFAANAAKYADHIAKAVMKPFE